MEEESNTLANDVRDAENRVTLLESQADDDTVLLEEARKKAQQAKLTAEEAADKIRDALEKLQNIQYSLGE